VLAVGGEKSFGPMMATVMRFAATNVQQAVVPHAGHWLIRKSGRHHQADQGFPPMMPLRACMQSAAVSVILVLAITTATQAEPREQQLRLTPSDIAAMAKGGAGAGTSGVSGIQTTVLSRIAESAC
jgi:hypothetical protein